MYLKIMDISERKGNIMTKKKKYGKVQVKNFKWIYAFLLPTIIIFVMFYVQPIVVMLTTSFTKWDGFNDPAFNGISNYIKLFTNSASAASIKNLHQLEELATMGVDYAAVPYALYMKSLEHSLTTSGAEKFKEDWEKLFMIPNIISAAAWALIYRFIFNDQMGVLNSVIRVFNKDFSVQWFYQSPYAFWAVTLTWLFYAVIVTLIVLNDLMAIPKELIEAAKLDGANGWQLIRFVELPLCRISIGTGMLCSITSRISMYEAIALTTAGGPGDDTMSLSVLLVRAITDYNYGFANAIGVIMFLIGLLVMYIVTKAFRMNDSIY